jgi:hypothetical protein
MAPKDICKFVSIIKSCLFDWIIMPFGMKNAINTFSKRMTKMFGPYLDKFLKVFVDHLNIHNLSWEEHLEHLWYVLLKLREVNIKFNFGNYGFAKCSEWIKKVRNQI